MAIAAILAAVAVPSSPGAAAPAEDGQIGIRLLEAPVSRRDDPRAHMYIVDHLKPGSTITRRFEVLNQTDQAREFEVYPGAASLNNDEFLPGADREGNELTSWIKLSVDKVVLQPGDTAEVEATIAVPDKASKGERYGVLWSETRIAPDKHGNIGAIRRAGIRVYLNVGPGGEPVSNFDIGEIKTTRGADGVPVISTAVTNTGERALDLTGTLSLSDGPGSMRAGPYHLNTATTLAPGATGIVMAALDAKLPDGDWKLDLELASGIVKHKLNRVVTLPPPGVSLVADGGTWPWSWIGLAGGGALLAVFTGAVALRRRRPVTPVVGLHYRPRHH
ncbi:hypothetical protein DFJ67_3350 [Asanoa ferruginea]|uniref:DUF916 domain-containing protein n=1 Tax=Asanoa ferruginea TaxID=53367 RepID=A0A3D9ZN24_9ACTN|nr:peptidase [Asanoa ferruginea]REF97353.1 hypothetical protein DFJ67_3350 [Asanoa ferruginea]GIF51181.1 hypothetical protein Afe04nite_57200 [Asanoa ferruginea]